MCSGSIEKDIIRKFGKAVVMKFLQKAPKGKEIPGSHTKGQIFTLSGTKSYLRL